MEQELIGRNAGIVWDLLNGKKSVELAHLKRNPNFRMQNSGQQ